MTLTEFVATGRFVKDLRNVPVLEDYVGLNDAPGIPQGMVYLDQLVIDLVTPDWPAATQAEGRWCLTIGNEQYVSDDLPLLELGLHRYAKDEGFFP